MLKPLLILAASDLKCLHACACLVGWYLHCINSVFEGWGVGSILYSMHIRNWFICNFTECGIILESSNSLFPHESCLPHFVDHLFLPSTKSQTLQWDCQVVAFFSYSEFGFSQAPLTKKTGTDLKVIYSHCLPSGNFYSSSADWSVDRLSVGSGAARFESDVGYSNLLAFTIVIARPARHILRITRLFLLLINYWHMFSFHNYLRY